MPDYIQPPIDIDVGSSVQEKIDKLEALIPGLVLQPGHPLRALLEVDGEYDAQTLQQASETLTTIFRVVGSRLLRNPPRDGVQASGLSTWTFADTIGHTILAGTQITLLAPDGTRVLFSTRNEVTIPGGSSATTVGAVELIAVDPGVAANGLQADPQPEEAIANLASIVVVAPTAGGEDAEDDAAYENRLADTNATLGYTLVLADDFAIDARNNVATIDRALVMSGFNPADTTSGNPGVVTVVPITAAGADPGGTVRTDLQGRQQALVPAGVTVYVDTPDYTTITVAFTGLAVTGYNPADVEARAEQAALDFLDPGRWGLPKVGDQRTWVDTPVVRRQDIITVLNNVDGFDYLTSLTLNGSSTNDVAMTGQAVLPAPAPTTTVSGTVTAP